MGRLAVFPWVWRGVLHQLIATSVCLGWVGGASAAEPSVDQCLDASERGQRQRDDGELKAARESFVSCSNQACPAVVQKDCVSWLSDVERRLPSLVISVKDPDGNDVGEVELRLDDATEGQTLDGSALVMDPGKRTFHFSRRGFKRQSLDVVVREGERARIVEVVLEPVGSAAPSRPPAAGPDAGPKDVGAGVPTSAWVLGGLGVIALGSYAYFGIQAQAERDDLDSCKPTCSESEVDSAKTKWLASNVSFGVAVVAIGVAVWISLDQPRTAHAGSSRLRAGVAPTRGGGVGVLSARF